MNTLELKGGILEMIASVDDLDSLKELKKLVADFVGNQSTDYWNELSEMEKIELENAIEESEDESNLIDHDEIMKKHKKWLGK